MKQADRLHLANSRVTAARLALDSFTDPATVALMIRVANRGRYRRKAQQQSAGPGAGEPSPALRARVIERDKSTCYMCHRKLPLEDLTLDHVIPRSRGGKTTADNLKVACNPCNERKGDRLVSECDWLKP